ncbi:hypothetical protein E2562_030670 [Oryza meyeriana var. granulata]|uniref:SMP domain-containing protein n=1 Tax=Oryza meyeriana var. granulata TaxID=110450 RepID=A0A6G1DPQ5_9ORYZ|nr:hypothetical protein E2562_030670 [Oryza meyeriana var. granulata]
MSQEQRRRSSDQAAGGGGEQGIRYGDVFSVSGNLADKPIAPQDAATMQSAENLVLGQTAKGGPAAAMQSAASRNEQIGVVGHDQATDATAEQGVTVSETLIPGGRIVTEFVAGQAVGQYVEQDDTAAGGGDGRGGGGSGAAGVEDATKITIGEALEAAAFAAGRRPVERSDGAAIQAAEVRATGLEPNISGGLAAQAQSAAAANLRAARDEDKTKLGHVLSVLSRSLMHAHSSDQSCNAGTNFSQPYAERDGEAGG